MQPMSDALGVFPLLGGAVAVGALLVPAAIRRIELSRAKHRSLAGHARLARRIATLLPGYEYSELQFFSSDRATHDVVRLRRQGFERLASVLSRRHARSIDATESARESISDMQFTGRYRIPYQYSGYVQRHLKVASFYKQSSGVMLTDLDGERFYDLTGSYGVNVFGNDFYIDCIEKAVTESRQLGPVLGVFQLHTLDVISKLKQLSGLDEISFHMSGTEAVMQAVRLARYHTGRRHVVRFCGAYHGWWEDVQPGPGNPLPPRETYTLEELSERSLQVISKRRDIACVLVNPLQALHPNRPAPNDGTLVDSGRCAGVDRVAYAAWLTKLREACDAARVPLIFDEIFVGFRLARGGAQEYFGVRADMVIYGKTLGGGLPVGVVCGKADLMRRFRNGRPADICFARGTFNSHPYVMAAMHAFLERLLEPRCKSRYEQLDERWDNFAQQFNARFSEEGLPIRVANLSSIWTVLYTEVGRYNWMFQYYLRAHGIALSWVGTGRLIFSVNFSDEDMLEVLERFVSAARQMRADGWWSGAMRSNREIRRLILKETIAAGFARAAA
jgi:glutamate-1-semialdehyde 2,1-aminomutase